VKYNGFFLEKMKVFWLFGTLHIKARVKNAESLDTQGFWRFSGVVTIQYH